MFSASSFERDPKRMAWNFAVLCGWIRRFPRTNFSLLSYGHNTRTSWTSLNVPNYCPGHCTSDRPVAIFLARGTGS